MKTLVYLLKIWLIINILVTWIYFTVSFDFSIVEDSCSNGKYNYDSYAGINCNKCWYHKDRLYLGYSTDVWDWYINKDGKEKMFSKRSRATFKFLNWASGTYNLYYGGKTLIDLIPAGVATNIKEAISFIIKNVKITTPVSYASKDKPAFIEVYKIITANTTSSGKWPIYPSDSSGKWVWTKGVVTNKNGVITLNTSRQFVDNHPRYYQTVSDPHYECYVWLVSWCWDWVTDSSYGEQCDNWPDNWDWNWTPIVKNGVVCNSSCKIVQPECWPAAKTYSADATNFDWDFCKSPSSLDGSTPNFPSQWSSVSWTCKLGDLTTTCTATREKNNNPNPNPGWWGWWGWWGWPGPGGNWWWNTQPKCWPASWQVLNAKPQNNLCDIWTPSSVTENPTSWSWTCSENSNSVNCEAYKSTCAIQWTCTNWYCWNFNWQTFDPTSPTDQSKLLKFENPQASDPDFCKADKGDTILSYNPAFKSKEFKWNCWTSECKAYIAYVNTGIIKIYGSYTWNTICPECEKFGGADLDLGTNKLFYSDIDTTYTRSIMSGDYLPIWWILPKYNSDYVTSCDASNVWKYNKNSVKVKFEVYDMNWNLKYTTQTYNGFNGWNILKAFHDVSVNWQAYIPSSVTKNLPLGEDKINWYIVSRQVCKGYDTDGDGLIDTYSWQTENPNLLFATQSFTVTDSYMIQNSPLSAGENTTINFNWKSLSWWLQQANYPISSVVTNYDKKALSKILWDFVKKYSTFATLCWVTLAWDSTINYCKVPTAEVYYVSWQNIILPEWMEFTIPTTLIVSGWDVTVRPDIKWYFMLVVKNWKIKIENQNMNKQSILDGYYVTDKWFEVTGPARSNWSILNTNPSNNYWYADWRLKINGALIGPNAENVYKRRRSFLVWWFDPSKGPAWAITHWASLIISSNSNLWLNAPIWLKDLFGALKIKKWY